MRKRWAHFAAMALIGDGVMAVLRPACDAQAWKAGPQPWQSVMRTLRRRPALTRALGVLEIAAGVCWVLQNERSGKRFGPADAAPFDPSEDAFVR